MRLGERHMDGVRERAWGNCCEHYLAATKEGWILNFGGEYPTWSEDRGLTWQEYRPTIFSQLGCLEPKPTVPGQEGLGGGKHSSGNQWRSYLDGVVPLPKHKRS